MKRKIKGDPNPAIKFFLLIADLFGEGTANDEPDQQYMNRTITELIEIGEKFTPTYDGLLEFENDEKKLTIRMWLTIEDKSK